MTKKKRSQIKNNPFTMWGSYAGAILGLLFYFYMFATSIGFCDFNCRLPIPQYFILVYPIAGFFTGWFLQVAITLILGKLKKGGYK